MIADPLGRREDQSTEFKAADALRQPVGIAREVVGMLNAGGGVVYIGVDDKEGEAVAINPVENPAREADRLLDFLVDTLDPSPTREEVAIETLSSGTDRAVLVVRVSPDEDRKPYSYRKSGGLHFLRRVGARNQPMSRQEIGQAFRDSAPQLETAGQAEAEAREKLTTALQRVRESVGEGLWVGMQPVPKLDLDPEDPRLEEIALNPSASGNRRSGWHFARTNRRPEIRKGRFEWGLHDEEFGYSSETMVGVDGGLEFRAALQLLHWKGEEREIWPVALLELSISAFRIARAIYHGHLDPDDDITLDVALLSVGGWGLQAGTPGDFFGHQRVHRLEEDNLVWEPETIRFRSLDEEPDLCGFRWIRRIYHAFDLREVDIPRQFDLATGILVLSD